MASATLTTTGSAVALHCCKAHARINTKIGNLTPCKTVTPENFSSKLCTRDYTSGTATTVQISVQIGSVEASPHIGEYKAFVAFLTVLSILVLSFFSRARPQVEPLDRFSRSVAQTTCFRARKCLLAVTTIDDVICENMPPKPPKKLKRSGVRPHAVSIRSRLYPFVLVALLCNRSLLFGILGFTWMLTSLRSHVTVDVY